MARRAFDPDDPDRMQRELDRGSDNRYTVAQQQQQAFEAEKARVAAISPALADVRDIYDQSQIPVTGSAPMPGLEVAPPEVGFGLGRSDFNPDGTLSIETLKKVYKGSGAEFQGIPFNEWLMGPSSPFQLNAQGTAATYVPEKQTVFPSYDPVSTGLSGFMEKAIPGLAMGLMGSGLLGALTGGAYGMAPGSLEAGAASSGGGITDFSSSFTNPQAVAGESFFNNTPVNLANSGATGATAGDVANFLNTSGTLGSGAANVGGAAMGSNFGPMSSIADMINGLSGGGSMISSGISGLGSAFGNIAGGAVSGMGGLTDILQTAGTGAGQGALEFGAGGAGNSIWSTIGKALGLGSQALGGNQAGGGQSGLGSLLGLLGGGLEWWQSDKNVDKLSDAIKSASEKADPFASQRPFYQDQLKQSYTDPNYFANNPVFAGMRDIATSDASRKMSAGGYTGSGNILHEIADRVQKQGMNYATQFQGQLAQNAGAGISPAYGANIAAQGANQVMQANQQANGAMGNTLANLPGALGQVGNVLQGLI
jgi:hypothetical protein